LDVLGDAGKTSRTALILRKVQPKGCYLKTITFNAKVADEAKAYVLDEQHVYPLLNPLELESHQLSMQNHLAQSSENRQIIQHHLPEASKNIGNFPGIRDDQLREALGTECCAGSDQCERDI
jgi:hypothetical protein